jgi:hypothetical protein
MDFLKKNYEKVLLGVVLLGLTIAVASLPFIISSARQKIEDAANQQLHPVIKPLPDLDTKLEDDVLQRASAPYKLDFTSKHNLFNPVLWQKLPDTRLIKIVSGNELGAGALVVTNISPLYLKLTYKSPTGSPDAYFVMVEDQGAPRGKSGAHETIVGKDAKGDYNLLQVKGPPDKPTGLELQVKETSEKFSLSADRPYTTVDGYTADLKYPPEAGWIRNNQRVGSLLVFGGAQYKIVAITQSNVVVSAQSND